MPPIDDVEGQEQEAREAPSMAETIAAAMDAAEAAEKPEEQGAKPEKPEKPEGSESETEGAAQEAKVGLKRDKEGKLAAKEDKPATEIEKPGVEQKPEVKAVRAPGSWRPATREKFAKLDPDVQQEIMRREREISQGFNEVTEVKKFREHFMGSVNQYAHVINAEGGKPLETIHNLLQTANVLYTGTPVQKAHTVAAIIKNFGISLEALDEVLSGQQPDSRSGQGNADIASLIEQGIAKALGPLTQRQQEAAQQSMRATEEELYAFLDDPKNEFAHDVRETMADLLEAAANRGQKMTLQTAYSRAILAHNDIAEVVERRRAQESVARSSAAAAAAKKKSVSITGAPDKIAPGSGNMRDTIIAAMEQHGV